VTGRLHAVTGERRLGAPWTGELLAGVLVANLVGLAVIAAGGYESGQTTTERDALSWLILSALGLAVCGTANAMLLLRVRQSIARAVRLLLDPRERAVLRVGEHRHDDSTLVGVVGARRYHRPRCPLVAGKRVQTLDPEAARADRIACEICHP